MACETLRLLKMCTTRDQVRVAFAAFDEDGNDFTDPRIAQETLKKSSGIDKRS